MVDMGVGEALAISAAISAATTGAEAAMSAVQARQRNDAIARSMKSQQQAANEQMRQVNEQAAVERQKRLDEAHRIQGRIRVAAGESGLAMGGSFAALEQQSIFDAQRNLDILAGNRANALRRIQTGLTANATELQSQRRDPILDAFAGGVSGLSTGFSISGGLKDAGVI